MKEATEVNLVRSISDIVVTVPAYITDFQRQAKKDAGAISGLNVLRFINELAAIAYDLKRLVTKVRNIFVEFKSSASDTHLGGEDVDIRMVNHFMHEFKQKHKLDKDAMYEIVLVGGSTRIFKVRQWLRGFFSEKGLNRLINSNKCFVLFGVFLWGKQMRLRVFGADVVWWPMDVEKGILLNGHIWILEDIKNSDLRGRGGFSFLTGMKLGFMNRPSEGRPTCLFESADKGEPGTCKEILRHDPHALIEGSLIVEEVMGVIAIYMWGGETAPIESIEEERDKPRIKPLFPADIGLFSCPTIVTIVEVVAVCGECFDLFGKERNKDTNFFYISGRFNNRSLVEENRFIPLKAPIKRHCGSIVSGGQMSLYQYKSVHFILF